LILKKVPVSFFIFFYSCPSMGWKVRSYTALQKGAVCSGVRAMALELAQRKIRVNAVLPSIVRTEMIDFVF